MTNNFNEKMIPSGAKEIIDALERCGYAAYLVGGCVRDAFLGRIPHDWDIATSAAPYEVKSVFAGEKVVATGEKYGTLTIIKEDGEYEVTTFRRDSDYSDGRRPDWVTFAKTIEEDLSRRDFTINAMAYSPKRGLADPFDGRSDLEKGLIRCVGNPDERFAEDALRILRAVRFAAVLGFEIEKATEESAGRNLRMVDNTSAERKRDELLKALAGKAFCRTALKYKSVICKIVPELAACIGFDQKNVWHKYDVYDHIMHAVDEYEGSDLIVKMALLLHDVGKPEVFFEDTRGGHFYGHAEASARIAEKVMDDLHFSCSEVKEVVQLIAEHNFVANPSMKGARKMVNRLGEIQARRLIEVKKADILAHSDKAFEKGYGRVCELGDCVEKVLASEGVFTMRDLAVNGRDIMATGIAEGPEVGRVLKKLFADVEEGILKNDRGTLLERARLLKE